MQNIYAEINKVDDEQRMVYGYASTEALDAQGEIVKLDAIKDALPEYMKFGNVREMHQSSAVGLAKSAELDDKGLYLAAKIVDDNAWNKVKQGVYKGFSIGGKSLEKIEGIISKMRLTEISLVDRPANPEATIELFKADDIQAPDTGDMLKRFMGEEAMDAKRAIDALHCIYELYEFESKEPDEPPEQLENLRAVIDNLKAFIASEIMETHEGEGLMEAEEMMEMSEQPDDISKAEIAAVDQLASLLNDGTYKAVELLELAKSGLTIEKAGSRHSKGDYEHIQKMHDHAIALGASCGMDKEAADTGTDIAKLAADMDILKSERDALSKRVAELEAMPQPMKAARVGISKADDTKINPTIDIDAEAERIAKSANPAAELIKRIHAQQR